MSVPGDVRAARTTGAAQRPRTTSPAAEPRASPAVKSSAALSATSPELPRPQRQHHTHRPDIASSGGRLTKNRSVRRSVQQRSTATRRLQVSVRSSIVVCARSDDTQNALPAEFGTKRSQVQILSPRPTCPISNHPSHFTRVGRRHRYGGQECHFDHPIGWWPPCQLFVSGAPESRRGVR